jgi:hypothetical protein
MNYTQNTQHIFILSKNYKKKNMKKILLLLLTLQQLSLADLHVQTTTQQTTMIELFSSEGCSSCPPAEHWVNQYVNHPDLWKSFIPLVYHVDYWDNLGWEDRFAKYSHSQRQRAYAQQGYTSGVYTPGFFLNSKEWKGWFTKDKIKLSTIPTDILTLDVKGTNVKVTYLNSNINRIHIALLGFGLETKVPKGENRGKVLKHDFVVLNHTSYLSKKSISITELLQSKTKAKRYAIVVWITKPNSMQVLQSTGGWL